MFKLIALLATSILFFSHVSAETILRVAYEDKVQFPYYMGDGATIPEDKPGSAVELVQLLETKIPDLRVELKRFPWKRCLSNLKDGQVDATFNASYKKERLAMGAYPEKDGNVDTARRLTTISYSIYTTKQAEFVWDGKSFLNLDGKIGAPTGYSIVGDLKKMGVDVAETGSTEANLKKVLAGRVAGAALQDVTGDFYVRSKKEFNDLVKVTPPLKTKPYYLMISHQFKQANPELAEKIWDAIAELRESNLTQLSEKYFD